jgi:hypothetical protein
MLTRRFLLALAVSLPATALADLPLTDREVRDAIDFNNDQTQNRGFDYRVRVRIQQKVGVTADGDLGPRSVQAIARWQQKNKIAPNGKVGPVTWQAMGIGVIKLPNGISTATGYVSGRARQIRVTRVDGKPMEVETARAFLRMKKSAARSGVSLVLVSGFRTMAEQQYLYNGYINGRPGFNLAARPGYSNHQSGAAVDLNTIGTSQSNGTGTVYNWLARNAARFGFKRIPAEHWHWEYQPVLDRYR